MLPPAGGWRGRLPYPQVMADTQEARQKQIAISAIVGTAILFVIMLGALAVGNAFLAGMCFLVLVLGWFAVRSFLKDRS